MADPRPTPPPGFSLDQAPAPPAGFSLDSRKPFISPNAEILPPSPTISDVIGLTPSDKNYPGGAIDQIDRGMIDFAAGLLSEIPALGRHALEIAYKLRGKQAPELYTGEGYAASQPPHSMAGKAGRMAADMGVQAAAFGGGNALAAGLPLAGRMAVQSGIGAGLGAIESGGNPLATGIGALGGAAGEVAGVVVPKALRGFQSVPSESAVSAQDLGIPLKPGDYSDDGRGRRIIERFLMNRATGRQPFFNAVQEQNIAAQGAASKIAGNIGEAAPAVQTGSQVADILGAQDQSATKSLLDAEAQRVARINTENKAAQAGQSTYLSSLNDQRLQGQANALGELSTSAQKLGPLRQPDEAGTVFQSAVAANAQKFKQEASQLYTALDDAMPGVKISAAPTAVFMQQLGDDLKGVAGATARLRGADVPKIVDLTESWAHLPKEVSFSEAQQILSSLKAVGREYKDLINTRYPGVINKLTATMEAQMQQAAAKNGALDLYKQANTFYRKGATLFNDSAAAGLMDRNPEQISDAIWKRGAVTPIQEVKEALAGQPQAWDAVRRRGFEDLVDKSSKDGVIDADRLSTEWGKLGVQVQKEMAGDQWKVLNDQIATLKTSQMPFDTTVPTPKDVLPTPVKISLTPQQVALRRIANSRPETLGESLLSDGAETMGTELRAALKDQPAVFNQVRRQAFDSLVSKNSLPPVAGGEPIVDGKALSSHWNSLSPGQRSLIAGDQLPTVNKLMTAVNGLDTRSLNTLHRAIYGGLLDPSVGFLGLDRLFMHGDIKGAAAAALLIAAPNVISRAWLSPVGRRWLTEGLTIPVGTKAAATWATRGAAFAAEQAAKPDESLQYQPRVQVAP